MSPKDQIHEYIGRNNITEAIKVLDKHVSEESKPLVTGIKAEQNALNFQRIAGTASHSQLQITTAQLIQRILTLADQMTGEMGQPTLILLVSANPEDTTPLKVREEMDAIRAIFRGNDKFIVKSLEYASRNDLITSIQTQKPNILHFCGHGSQEGIYLLEEKTQKHSLLNNQDLTDILLLNRSIQFVLLNSCYGLAQLRELRRNNVAEMVGMPKQIEDGIAMQFAKAFFKGVLNGQKYSEAYQGAYLHDFVANLPSERKPIWFEKL